MKVVFMGITPAVLLFLVFAILGLPGRRGRTKIRWRSLRLNSIETEGLDVSREASVRLIAGRADVIISAIFLIVIFWLIIGSGLSTFASVVLSFALALPMLFRHVAASKVYAYFIGRTSPLLEASFFYRSFSIRGLLAGSLHGYPEVWLTMQGIGLLIGAGLSWVARSDIVSSALTSFAMVVWGANLIAIGRRLDRRRRRNYMLAKKEVREAIDERKPAVLFLRQFGTEETLVPCHASPRVTF